MPSNQMFPSDDSRCYNILVTNNLTSPLVRWAYDSSSTKLLPLRQRWNHVCGVAVCATEIQRCLKDGMGREYLLAAVYLHDIGYAPELAKVGFHPLDGARFILDETGDRRLASLVAHHSGARFEAELRGFSEGLAQFPRERSYVADALDYCDMTTGISGQHITFHDRRADIFQRYGREHIVAQSLQLATPFLSMSIARITRKLKDCVDVS